MVEYASMAMVKCNVAEEHATLYQVSEEHAILQMGAM